MRLKDYGRYRKKRKEYIHQSGLLLTGVMGDVRAVIMGDVRAELALVMHILHERPAFRPAFLNLNSPSLSRFPSGRPLSEPLIRIRNDWRPNLWDMPDKRRVYHELAERIR